MGYYDFDHFWSPEEVCAQQATSESTLKVVREIRKFLHELLGRNFCGQLRWLAERDRHLSLIQSPKPDSIHRNKSFQLENNNRDI